MITFETCRLKNLSEKHDFKVFFRVRSVFCWRTFALNALKFEQKACACAVIRETFTNKMFFYLIS